MTVSLARPYPGVTALADRLLVQCGPDDTGAVVPLLRDGSGLVVTGKHALRAAAAVRGDCPGPVLADRGRYAGTARETASAPLSAAWTDAQLASGGTAALTDSGYIDRDDTAGLVSVLSGTARLGPGAIAVLPLHCDWLGPGLGVLIEEVNAHGVPVALVLEHPDDPFGTRRTVRGLTTLLARALVPVLLLRSDTSAVGALAHGASAAAFGVRSSLRHLFRPPAQGKGFRATSAVSAALWKPGLYMVKTDRLAAARARTPDDPLWVCECSVCRGRTVDWLHLDAAPAEVLAHTLEVVLDLRDGLASLPDGPLRRLSWREMCFSAEFEFSSAAATAVRWDVPPAVKWWQQV